MNKKLLSCVALLTLAATTLSGCGAKKVQRSATAIEIEKTTPDTYPIETDEKLTYWVQLSGHVSAHSQSLNDTPLAKDLAEKTGITVEFMHPAAGQEQQQLGLLVASNDVPDIIETGWGTYTGGAEKAIKDGVILGLNNIIDTVSPNLKKIFEENPDYDKATQTETGINYVYPFIIPDDILQTFRGPMVRADYLEKFGLTPPETIEEWETMLRTFKENGIKVPLTLRMNSSMFQELSPFIGAYGVGGGFYVDNKTVKFGPYQPEYKEFLTLMRNWYSEGLLDPNFTDTDSKRLTAVMASGEGGSAFGSAGGDFGTWIPAAQAQNPDARFVPVNYPVLNKGETPKFGQKNFPITGHGAAITAKSKNIELAARFLDFGYSEDGHMTYNFGKEGESYTMIDGKPIYTDIVTKDKNGIGPGMGRYIRACYNGPFAQDSGYLMQFYANPVQLEAVKEWSQTDMLNYKLPNAPMTEEENKEYAKIMKDIDTYVEEVMFKTITGKSSLEEIDAYYTELKNRGIERAVELKQAAYDRYIAD